MGDYLEDEAWLERLARSSRGCISYSSVDKLIECSQRLIKGLGCNTDAIRVVLKADKEGLRLSIPVSQLPEAWHNLLHVICIGDYTVYEDFIPRRGWRVIDAGAYLGFYTCYAALKTKQEGLVVAVEPNPLAREWIYVNAASNRLENRIRVDPRALSSLADTIAELYIPEYWANSSLLENYNPGGYTAPKRKVKVRTISLERLLREHGLDKVDLLKMDIEGVEGEVLEASTPLLKDKVIDRLVIEVHPPYTTTKAITNILKETGYRIVGEKVIGPNQAIVYATR